MAFQQKCHTSKLAQIHHHVFVTPFLSSPSVIYTKTEELLCVQKPLDEIRTLLLCKLFTCKAELQTVFMKTIGCHEVPAVN